MSYLKHNSRTKQAKESNDGKRRRSAEDYADERFYNSRCIEEAIDGLASVIGAYVTNARNGDNAQPFYSNPTGYPVKIAFEDWDQALTIFVDGEAVDSIADSLKRIADAMSATKPEKC